VALNFFPLRAFSVDLLVQTSLDMYDLHRLGWNSFQQLCPSLSGSIAVPGSSINTNAFSPQVSPRTLFREEPEKVSTLGFRKSIQDLVQSITQYAAKHAIATPGIQRTDLPKDSIRELEPAAPSIVAFRNAMSKQTIVVARRAMACERSGGGKENSKPTVARQDMD